MNGVNKNIPVVFERQQQYDTRFERVKIWLMHLGKNYNNSIFTKEAVEGALDSLKNTPILGYIEESRMGDRDFRGHESKLVVENGDYKMKYIGQAFGVIPEFCNPRFERKLGDDGQELEYLVVDGLLWTKFDDAISILGQSSEVPQSMELHDEYDGYFEEDGTFVFTKFAFYGACMLGQDVPPAMQKASVEKVFMANAIQEEIAKKLEEYCLSFGKEQFKEVNNEMEETVKVDMTEEVVLEETEVSTEMEVEADKVEVSEEVKEVEFAEKDDEDEDDDKSEDKESDKDDEDEDEDKKSFSNMEAQLSEYKTKVTELESEVQRLNNQVTSLESEKVELEQFKASVNKAQHEAKAEELFAQFGKLDASDYADIKENIHNFSIEEIEGKLFERLGRKMANFTTKSKVEEKVVLKVSQNEEDTSIKSGYSHLFTKHGIK